MNLADYRRSAETFVSELTGEYYRHFAGLKASYEIEPIYARHAELFAAGAIDDLRARVDAAPTGSDDRRRLTMLLDFAVEGYIGQATKEPEAELARLEASLAVDVDGEELGFRESAVIQANEPDAARRVRIEAARLAVTEQQLNPLHRALIERQHTIAQELGYGSYRELCEVCKGFDLSGLHAQTEAFRAETEAGYGPLLDAELRRTISIGLAELRRADLPRFFRAPGLDDRFPQSHLLNSFSATLRGLGIELSEQPGVVLDVEQRPKKSPRAFCAPVRVPDEIYLVLSPVGGRDDYAVLFHEGGHTEHYANVDAELPFEFRHLGDNSITEAFAFLFQHLVENPVWLARRLGISDADAISRYARAYRLLYLRRYTAKLSYELELHDGSDRPWSELAARYADGLGRALRIEWPRQTFLADVDPGFYCACYLRAWALETNLRRHLSERFGPAWFETAEAGDALRSMWRVGQRLGPDELLEQLTGERLDFGALVGDLGMA
jgi:hypothetical protein